MRREIIEINETEELSTKEVAIKLNEIIRWINKYVGVDSYGEEYIPPFGGNNPTPTIPY